MVGAICRFANRQIICYMSSKNRQIICYLSDRQKTTTIRTDFRLGAQKGRTRTGKLFAMSRTGRNPLRLEEVCVLGLKKCWDDCWRWNWRMKPQAFMIEFKSQLRTMIIPMIWKKLKTTEDVSQNKSDENITKIRSTLCKEKAQEKGVRKVQEERPFEE